MPKVKAEIAALGLHALLWVPVLLFTSESWKSWEDYGRVRVDLLVTEPATSLATIVSMMGLHAVLRMGRSTGVGVAVGRYFMVAVVSNLCGLQAWSAVLRRFGLRDEADFLVMVSRNGVSIVAGAVTNYMGAGMLLAKLEACELAIMSEGAVWRIRGLRRCQVLSVVLGFTCFAAWLSTLAAALDAEPPLVFFRGIAVAMVVFLLCEPAVCWQALKLLTQSIYATASDGQRADVTSG